MLPLSLLNVAVGSAVQVELKTGATLNGHLSACDSFMNLLLAECVLTAADGARFWRLPECYVKGSTVKFLRVPDAIVDKIKDDAASRSGSGRGGRGRGGAFRPSKRNTLFSQVHSVCVERGTMMRH